MESRLTLATRDREDLQQELATERSRASAAEARTRKALDRIADLEQKVVKLQGALVSSDSPDIPARRRASRSPVGGSSPNVMDDSPLLRIVRELTQENEVLRAEVAEVRGHLRNSREEQADLLSELETRGAFADSDDLANHTATASLLSEVLMRPPSPTDEGASRSSAARSWAPSTNYFGSGGPRSSDSVTTNDDSPAGAAQHTHYHYHLADASLNSKRRRGTRRSAPSRRSQSIDLGIEAPNGLAPSPSLPASPPSRLSFQNATPPGLAARLSTLPPLPASPEQGLSLNVGPSNLSLTSPERRRIALRKGAIDASTQTEGNALDWLARDPYGMPSRERVASSSRTAPSIHSDGQSEPSERDALDGTPVTGESSSGKTALLADLMRDASGLLSRIQGANVAALEARLRKQNLRGDVKHLASSAMRDIVSVLEDDVLESKLTASAQVSDVDALRVKFQRSLLHENQASLKESAHHSLVTRRDFRQLLRLVRDVLAEVSRLRSIVNTVQLEPALATQIAQLEAGPASPSGSQPSTPGFDPKAYVPTFLAPISRLWSGAASTEVVTPPSAPVSAASLGKGRPTMTATKRTTSTGITSATVNVEFGGGGMSSRQKTVASSSPLASAPEGVGGIFAGGGLRRPRSRWALVDRPGPGATTSSSGAPKSRSRDDHDAGDKLDSEVGDFRQTLLERTLRPRGLSDSSMHSTFVQHAAAAAYANPTGRLLKSAAQPVAATTTTFDVARRTGVPMSAVPATPPVGAGAASWVKPVRIPSASQKRSTSAGSSSRVGSPAASSYAYPKKLESRRREGDL